MLTREHLATLAYDWPAARAGSPMDRQAWIERARQATDVRAALPPRFGTVLDDLLNALESSALFTDESCSFSQGDVLDGIGVWLDKAQRQLKPPTS